MGGSMRGYPARVKCAMTASARGSTKDKALPRKTQEIAPLLARLRRLRDRFCRSGPRSLSDSGAQSDKSVSRETYRDRKPYKASYARWLARWGNAQKNCLFGHGAHTSNKVGKVWACFSCADIQRLHLGD